MQEKINKAAAIRGLCTVKKKQDDTNRCKDERDPEPGLSSRSQLALGLQIISASGTQKDYR